MRTILAIPAYNCARQLPRVLDGIDDRLARRLAEIWVVDNGSTDGTVAAVTSYPRTGGLPRLRVFRNRANYGLGGTHKAVFERAGAVGATHVLVLHGDNQAVSAEGGLLLDAAEGDAAARTVLGSRFNAASTLVGYDRRRVWGNRVLSALYSRVTGRCLEDLGSGLNLFALQDLERAAYLRLPDGLTFNYGLLLDLAARSVDFRYMPITWRQDDEISNARSWQVFLGAIVGLGMWRLGWSRRAASRSAIDYEWDEVGA